MPSDILTHVVNTQPYINSSALTPSGKYDLDNLATLNRYGDGVFLTASSVLLDNQSWHLGEKPDQDGALHNSTACAVIVIEKSDHIVDAFYFYFYSSDQGASIDQVVQPLKFIMPDAGPDEHFGNHVGDW
jgi:hypothetical protein